MLVFAHRHAAFYSVSSVYFDLLFSALAIQANLLMLRNLFTIVATVGKASSYGIFARFFGGSARSRVSPET